MLNFSEEKNFSIQLLPDSTEGSVINSLGSDMIYPKKSLDVYKGKIKRSLFLHWPSFNLFLSLDTVN